MTLKSNELMVRLVSLCKRRGFLFPSSEIYGGINGFWDYGPLGVELKRNIKEAWWQDVVLKRSDVVGLDCSIMACACVCRHTPFPCAMKKRRSWLSSAQWKTPIFCS